MMMTDDSQSGRKRSREERRQVEGERERERDEGREEGARAWRVIGGSELYTKIPHDTHSKVTINILSSGSEEI
jgi:hypothetical protein